MNLDHLYPFAGQHAIQSAVFGLDFASELDVGEVGALRSAANALVSDFPVVKDQALTTFSVEVVSGQIPTSSANSEVGGFVMEKPAISSGGSNSRFIVVSRTGIVVVVNDYTRWDRFRDDVNRYLSILLFPIDGKKAIANFGLQFNDIFLWKADPADLDVGEIFSMDNPYIARNSLAQSSLWHSHHGYLVDSLTPVPYQQLDNINVSRVAVSEEHQIQILTSHRVTLGKPLYKIWSANKEIFIEIQECLHARNKEILNAMLMPEVQLKINLNIPKEM